ncbi:hypothetical protein [Cyclobacterium xiamenense]|uniref:hypothetical protein n=1 Tax=Cyclobacterium xiamenense TaxID=1297121 RepID=UPI0012B87AD1|nr:hypothetical protein [Cyclobacterium xiamenense]
MKIKQILFLLFVMQGSLGSAQVRSVFEGAYTFHDKAGTATFEFLQNEAKNTVLDGFFRFNYLEKDSLDQTILYKFQVTGEYEQNERSGNWLFDQETHRVDVQDVVNFEVVSSLHSDKIYVEAVYNQGKKTGTWAFKQNEFVNGELRPKAEANGITFTEGKITENIDYRAFEGDYTQLIRGEVNAEGYLDGEWALVYLKEGELISEVRNYEKGFLLGIKQRNLETGARVNEVIFHKTIEKLQKLEEAPQKAYKIADRDFGLVYNDGFQSNSLPVQIQKSGNRFINDFISKLLQYDNRRSEQAQNDPYPIRTRRFAYAIYDELDELIATIRKKYQVLKDSTEKYAGMNALALNKEKSDSLAYTHAFFSNRREKLKQMEELMGLIRSGDIRYYDLTNFTAKGVGFLSPLDLINYSYQDQDKRKIINREVGYANPRSFLERVDSHLEEELTLGIALARYARRQLQSIEVSQNLVALEEELTEKRSLVETLYENHESSEALEQQFFEKFSGHFLHGLLQENLSGYATADDPEEKVTRGKQLLDFLTELELRYPELAAIFPRNEEIDALYKEETFDPFTYTRYQARAKSRLYEAGMNILLPYYLTELTNEADYGQIKNHLDAIELLQQKLIDLRDRSTKGLERKLGRTKNPERVRSLLDL